MSGYSLINISDMLQELGEDKLKNILSTYMCPHNEDLEYFLRDKAIEFSKQGIAATHLVFTSYKDKPVLIGYFSLANKFIFIPKKLLSQTLKKRVSKFGTREENGYSLGTPLIAQLGKNYTNDYNTLITGDELLAMAINKVKQIQSDLGGRIVYLECEDVPYLIEFYSSNGFLNFGKRNLDPDERNRLKGTYLVQMLKYLHIDQGQGRKIKTLINMDAYEKVQEIKV